MRDRLCAGEPVIGTWVSLSDPAVAEILAPDFDFVVLDTEHAPNSLETVTDSARAVDAAAGDALPLARVPWNDPVRIKRTLDTGVAGVIVPMVEDSEAAEAAVAACRYPPAGVRGMAASRASEYGRSFDSYVERANEDVLTVLQIETATGVENVADIAAVDGVDALLVGPADLSANLGALGEWESDTFADAVATIVEEANDAGTPVGTLGIDPDQVRTFADLGFDYLVAGVDASMLLASADRLRSSAEDAL